MDPHHDFVYLHFPFIQGKSFCTLLGCTEFLILATIHQKLPKVQRTWKLRTFDSYIMPNKLSPDEVRQWSESGVIEMTKKAESKTWRLLRENHGAGTVSWEIWISISSYLMYVIQYMYIIFRLCPQSNHFWAVRTGWWGWKAQVLVCGKFGRLQPEAPTTRCPSRLQPIIQRDRSQKKRRSGSGARLEKSGSNLGSGQCALGTRYRPWCGDTDCVTLCDRDWKLCGDTRPCPSVPSCTTGSRSSLSASWWMWTMWTMPASENRRIVVNSSRGLRIDIIAPLPVRCPHLSLI